MDKINDVLSNSKNANILEACGLIFRTAVAEQQAAESGRSSASSFTVVNGTGNHLTSLQAIGMLGLANNHQFLPSGRSLPLIKWINELVTRIIE